MKWKINRALTFIIVASFLLFLGLLFAVLVKKLTFKVMIITLIVVWGTTLLFFLVRAFIRRLTKSKIPLFTGGLYPELDKDRVINALRRYFSDITHIPFSVNESDGKVSYPYGSFTVVGEDNYYAGKEFYYILELLFEAGERRGQVWTIRVPVHQSYSSISKGNKVRADHCSIEEWKRNPREKPDIPLTDEKNILFSNLMGTLDSDYRKSPEFNKLILDNFWSNSPSLDHHNNDEAQSFEPGDVLARENVYKKRRSTHRK